MGLEEVDRLLGATLEFAFSTTHIAASQQGRHAARKTFQAKRF
jgi:hypothetical protein